MYHLKLITGNAFNEDVSDKNTDYEKLLKDVPSTNATIFWYFGACEIDSLNVVCDFDGLILPSSDECILRISKIMENILKFK
ncbi:17748_t:CDS:2, partial [Entrophospora sp. SA101]